MPLYHTGLPVIRAWVEKGSLKPFRAHIRATSPPAFEYCPSCDQVPGTTGDCDACNEVRKDLGFYEGTEVFCAECGMSRLPGGVEVHKPECSRHVANVGDAPSPPDDKRLGASVSTSVRDEPVLSLLARRWLDPPA